MENLDQYYLNRWSNKSDWLEIGPTKKKRLENLLFFLEKYVDKPTSIKLIDYGCGSGWLFHYLKEYGIDELYGYDVTPSTLKIVNEKYPFVKKLWCKEEDMSNKPPNNYFDFCTSIEVIEHVPFSGKPNYLNEIHSTLKDGGFLYLTTPNGKYFETGIKEYQKQPTEDWNTPSQMVSLINKAGFRVITKGSISIHPHLSSFHRIILKSKASKIIKKIGLKSTLLKLMYKNFWGLSTYYFCQKK